MTFAKQNIQSGDVRRVQADQLKVSDRMVVGGCAEPIRSLSRTPGGLVSIQYGPLDYGLRVAHPGEMIDVLKK